MFVSLLFINVQFMFSHRWDLNLLRAVLNHKVGHFMYWEDDRNSNSRAEHESMYATSLHHVWGLCWCIDLCHGRRVERILVDESCAKLNLYFQVPFDLEAYASVYKTNIEFLSLSKRQKSSSIRVLCERLNKFPRFTLEKTFS